MHFLIMHTLYIIVVDECNFFMYNILDDVQKKDIVDIVTRNRREGNSCQR